MVCVRRFVTETKDPNAIATAEFNWKPHDDRVVLSSFNAVVIEEHATCNAAESVLSHMLSARVWPPGNLSMFRDAVIRESSFSGGTP